MYHGLYIIAYIFAYREVAVNMLLKLVKHSRVIMLLTHVLDHYKEKQSRWNEVLHFNMHKNGGCCLRDKWP